MQRTVTRVAIGSKVRKPLGFLTVTVSVSITDPFYRCYNFLKINDLLQRITSSNRKQNALLFFSGDQRGNAMVDRLELRQRARSSFWGAATLSRVPNRPFRRLPLRQPLESSGVVLLVRFASQVSERQPDRVARNAYKFAWRNFAEVRAQPRRGSDSAEGWRPSG